MTLTDPHKSRGHRCACPSCDPGVYDCPAQDVQDERDRYREALGSIYSDLGRVVLPSDLTGNDHNRIRAAYEAATKALEQAR